MQLCTTLNNNYVEMNVKNRLSSSSGLTIILFATVYVWLFPSTLFVDCYQYSIAYQFMLFSHVCSLRIMLDTREM